MKSLAVVAVAALTAGVFYGFLVHKHKLFPYRYLNRLAQMMTPADSYGTWAIGIYEGATPFALTDAKGVTNPVLTAKDVTDIEAVFVADPFVVHGKDRSFMFFEVLNRKTRRGDIGYATSADGRNWKYGKIVLAESFHLSYPYVFEWNGEHYMVPESHQDLAVRLYKATSFPEKWAHVANLLTGYRFVDASLFRAKDLWWMFASTDDNDALNLYYSRELATGWQPHPANPVVKRNRHIARPGGRVIAHEGRLYRFAQDDYPDYGIHAFAFEIIELSESRYAERPVSEKPVVGPGGSGWNAAGMHHVDAQQVGGSWIAAVDGRAK